MRIAVAGGTGLTGAIVVEHLRAAHDEIVVLSRAAGVDLLSGKGLAAALTGVQVVIDVSNVVTIKRHESEEFFRLATRNLLDAEAHAGVAHHVALSIVGVDRVDLAYYFGKRIQEELSLNGPVPATVLRATQFHEFASQMLDRPSSLPAKAVLVPQMLCQPIAVHEVADALVRAAHESPAGLLPDLAGPHPLALVDMVRGLVRVRGLKKRVLSVRVPGAGGKAAASGGLLPTSEGPRGVQTYDQWLATQRRASARESGMIG